jgi:monooxygenase
MDWLAKTAQEAPEDLHAFRIESVRPLLPEGFDVDKHITPPLPSVAAAHRRRP